MENIKFNVLKKSPLFYNIAEKDLEIMLNCLSVQEKTYPKNTFIFNDGDNVSTVGIVLRGSVHIIKEDFWGNRRIISQIGISDIFAETFSCAQVEKIPVSIVTNEKTEIMLIDYKRIINTCSSSCLFHSYLIQNMLKIIANKNILLTQKIEHITQRTTREKLISYLSAQAKISNHHTFTIPFNRQELADYLSVDRSAKSSELSKLQKEGLLKFECNTFKFIGSL